MGSAAERPLRLLTECGGVTTTVVEGYMQRAPAFMFASARDAKRFSRSVDEHLDEIAAAAEATTRVGRLHHITKQTVGPLRYLRLGSG